MRSQNILIWLGLVVLGLRSQHVEGCRTIYNFQASLDFIMESYLDEREEWSEGEEEEEEGKKGKKVGKKLNMGSWEEVGKKKGGVDGERRKEEGTEGKGQIE